MNRSKKVIWDEVRRLYEQELTPTEILADIKDRQYFDEKVIPSVQSIYDYLYRTGLSTSRLDEKRLKAELKEELQALKQSLQKKHHQKEVDLIIKAFKEEDISIDDLTKEKIAELKVLLKELVDESRKRENGQLDIDKLQKAIKILDTYTNTLIKARVLEGKATEHIDIEEKATILDNMGEKYLPKQVMADVEEKLKGKDDG